MVETNTGKPFDVTEAYSCFTSDVISSYCFGESFGFLQQVRLEMSFLQKTILQRNWNLLSDHFQTGKLAAEFQGTPVRRSQSSLCFPVPAILEDLR